MQPRKTTSIILALSLILVVFTSTVLSVSAAPLPKVGANVNVIQPGPLNSGDQNKLQQNEPTISIDPNSPNVLAAGANDYRRSRFIPSPRTIWMGYYRSTDGGSSWSNSLVPGFPGDSSSQGLASPASGLAGASDPVLAFDLQGNLYYSFIAFNAARFPDVPGPLQENGVFVAKYASDGATYAFTSTVDFNTASLGIFDDKNWLGVDNSPVSPFNGRVYTCWTRFLGFAPPPTSLFGGDRIMFSFSSDGGQSFSTPHILSASGPDNSILNQDCGIATAPDGAVYLSWATFASGNLFGPEPSGIAVAKSTDGGKSFSQPAIIATYNAIPRSDNSGRDCCGIFGFRTAREQQIAVDSLGRVYVSFFADSNPAPNFDSSGNIILANIDADVFVSVSINGGSGFTTTNVTANNVKRGADGNEVFPSIAAATTSTGTRIEVVYYTNINDPDHTDDNQPSLALNAGGPGPQALIDVYDSFSTNGGATWTSVRVTDQSVNANWPMFVGGTIPFYGDYLQVSSLGNVSHIAWTDNRNVIFTDPDLSTSAVEANNTGNRDQNIYTAQLTF